MNDATYYLSGNDLFLFFHPIPTTFDGYKTFEGFGIYLSLSKDLPLCELTKRRLYPTSSKYDEQSLYQNYKPITKRVLNYIFDSIFNIVERVEDYT
jgi:hypothetical protein